MKEKSIFILMILGMILFMTTRLRAAVACSANDQTSAFGDAPDSTPLVAPEAPPATPTPEASASAVSANQGVKIRLQNVSQLDFEQIEVRFRGHSQQFAHLAAGEISSERIFSEIYLSSYVKIVVDGQEYVQESIADSGRRHQYPITAGSYTYVLDFRTDHVLADLVPDSEPGKSSVASVIEALEATGATVSHEPTIQHQNIFDQLFGEPVATRERLQINLTHVEIYVFEDATTANPHACVRQRRPKRFSQAAALLFIPATMARQWRNFGMELSEKVASGGCPRAF